MLQEATDFYIRFNFAEKGLLISSNYCLILLLVMTVRYFLPRQPFMFISKKIEE